MEGAIAVDVKKASEEAGEDDSLVPLQSSDSQRAGTHHRGSRRPASDDASQVTSPICEKTELKDILAHACSTEGPAAASDVKGDSSAMEISAVEPALSASVEAAVSSPSDTLAATHEGALATEAELSSADSVCPSGAPECGSSAVDAATQVTEAQQFDTASHTAADSISAASEGSGSQEKQMSPAKNDSEFAGSSAFSLVEVDEEVARDEKPRVKVSAPVLEEAQAHKRLQAEGSYGTPSAAATARTAKLQEGENQPAAAGDKTDKVKPEERQHTHGSTMILDSFDSPLLQATLEEPSPAHICLQAHLDATPETVKCPIEDSPAFDAATAPQKQDAAGPGDSSCPRAKATVPALDMHAIGSPVLPSAAKDEIDAEPYSVPVATDERDMDIENGTAACPSTLTAGEQTGVETGVEALTPEPSPSAERLVSERSLDEAEISLLREVMSKPLDPADQVKYSMQFLSHPQC